jgi:hypothetical protein
MTIDEARHEKLAGGVNLLESCPGGWAYIADRVFGDPDAE